MPPLTVLTDDEVKGILHRLTKAEVVELQQSLRKSLSDYSTAKQTQDERAMAQPARTVIETEKENGKSTTLFMPSTSSEGLGMKVVTLPTAGSTGNATPQGALTIMANDGKPIGFLNAEELTAFRTALASSLLMTRRSKVKTVTVFGAGKQAYWHVRLALLLHGPTIRHVYMITQSFSTKARDFFKSMLSVDMEVKQREGWAETKFNMLAENYSEYSRLLKQQVRDADLILCATPSMHPLFHHEILTKPNGRLKARLIIAVGSYTKNMIELPPEIIQQAIKVHGHGQHIRRRAEEGGVILVDNATCLAETGELTRAGLEPHHVVEVGEILMLDDQFAHEYDNDDDDTTAVEDDESAVRASMDGLDISRSSLANVLGNIEAPTRASSRSSSFSSLSRRSSSLLGHRRSRSDLAKLAAAMDRKDSKGERKESKDGEQMSRWLSKGNVIYKSVGLGLMDLCVGAEIVRLAREKGVGTTFKDF